MVKTVARRAARGVYRARRAWSDVRRRRASNIQLLGAVPRDVQDCPDVAALARLAARVREPHLRRRLRFGVVRWDDVPGLVPTVLDAAVEALDLGRPSSAYDLARAAVAVVPQSRQAHRTLAHVHGTRGDWEEARREWAEAMHHRPGADASARERVAVERRLSAVRDAVRLLAASDTGAAAGPASEGLAGLSAAAERISEGPRFAIETERWLAATITDARCVPPEMATAYAATRQSKERTPSEVSRAIEVARGRKDDAEYDEALAVLAGVTDVPGVLVTEFVFLAAELLRARSHYDAARCALRLAERDRSTTARAATAAAQAAWIQHDYGGGIIEARRALESEPGHAVAPFTLRRLENPDTPTPGDAPSGGIGHVAFYAARGGNFGDLALPVAVRQAVESATGTVAWLPFHAHQVFDGPRLELANAQRALVVGGGGLFLPDTSPNGNSGWQWNVPRPSLNALSVPLHVFAVGYNLFRGQSYPGGLFEPNLVALAERATSVGLRNHGSIARVRDLLPTELHDKVHFVPCPTTVLEHIHPGLPPAESGTGLVLVNAAFDRSARRFADSYAQFLDQTARYIIAVRAAGASVELVAHLPGDEKLGKDLADEHGIDVEIRRLYPLTPDEGYAVYRRASVVVGMRGHATMIPFGLGTPVLSLVSHPKMRFFLEDLDRTEWGFDVHDENFVAALTDRTLDILANEDVYRHDVASLQQMLLTHVNAAAARVAGGAAVGGIG